MEGPVTHGPDTVGEETDPPDGNDSEWNLSFQNSERGEFAPTVYVKSLREITTASGAPPISRQSEKGPFQMSQKEGTFPNEF